MDTAPSAGSLVTMPDPVRVVTRSVTTLRAHRFSETEALTIVIGCAQAAISALDYAYLGGDQWLHQIVTEAAGRLRVLSTPNVTPEGQCSHDPAATGQGRPGPESGAPQH